MMRVLDHARAGFGWGLGRQGASSVYTLVALAFFLPGLVMITRNQQVPKDKRDTTQTTVALSLMAVGVIIGSGLGSNRLFTAVQRSV